MKTFLAVLALATAMFAQTTTNYIAVAGTVHPVPGIPATIAFDPNYKTWAVGYPGLNYNYIQYILPDGTTAGVTTPKLYMTISNYTQVNNNPPTYKFYGSATGVDSTGAAVYVNINWTYHIVYGRYGGLRFDNGSLSVTK